MVCRRFDEQDHAIGMLHVLFFGTPLPAEALPLPCLAFLFGTNRCLCLAFLCGS